jgi:1-aminocyclopropane-1-carboxylate deaminase/D-cysteine desulfhydrase-like pyridoxal-dependent ACC family enzyme
MARKRSVDRLLNLELNCLNQRESNRERMKDMNSKELREEADRRCNTIVEGEVDDMAIISLVRIAYEIAAQLADLNDNLTSFDYKEGTRIFDVRSRQ